MRRRKRTRDFGDVSYHQNALQKKSQQMQWGEEEKELQGLEIEISPQESPQTKNTMEEEEEE